MHFNTFLVFYFLFQNNQKNMALKFQSEIEDLAMMIELSTKKLVAETKVY